MGRKTSESVDLLNPASEQVLSCSTLSTYTVARMLDRHPKTIRKMIRDGRLKALRDPRGKLVIRQSDLADYLDSLPKAGPKKGKKR